MTASGQAVRNTIAIGTPMIGWRTLQAAAPEHSAVAADFSTGWDFATQNAAGNLIDLQSLFLNSGSQIHLAFYSAPYGGQNPADGDTASIELVGYADISPDGTPSPPIMIAKLLGTVGTMPVEGVTNGLWIDTLVDSFGSYEGDFEILDSGDNRAARALADLVGLRYIRAHVYNALGASAGEAPSIAMIGRVY